MKTFLIVALLVVVMVLVGWINFSQGDGSASVTIDTDKVQNDTTTAVEKGKGLLKDSADAVEEESNDVERELEQRG